MNWFLKVLKQYADFKGRARRKEYWMFILFHMIFNIVLSVIDISIGTTVGEGKDEVGILALIYNIGVLVPHIAVQVRRLHDVGKSGWNIAFGLIPILGWIYVLYLLCKDSEPGDNKWGPNPKENEAVV